MLTGKPPFGSATGIDAKSLARLYDRDRSSSPEDMRASVPEIPNGLVALVERMLAKRPEDRPASAVEVAEQLTEYCG